MTRSTTRSATTAASSPSTPRSPGCPRPRSSRARATPASSWSTPRKVGVVEAGALADLIVVDGDPLADLSLARPQEALKAVIRDGAFVIDRLPQAPPAAT